MSNLVLHLFKKDMRHLRAILIVWALLILSQAALIGSGISASADNMATQVTFQILSYVLPLLKMIATLVMIPLLIQDEPLVGTTAFWFTRPMSRYAVLKSKAIFVGSILILFPLLVELAVFIGNGVLGYHVLLATPEILMAALSSAAQIMIIAVLTANFARYAIVGVIAFIALMLVSIAVYVGRMYLGGMAMFMQQDMTMMQSRHVVSSLVITITGIIVVLNQYLTRETRRSIVIASVGAVLMLLATNLWPVDFLKVPRVEPDRTVVKCDNLKLAVDDSSTTYSDAFQMRGKDEARKQIQSRIIASGLDDRFVVTPEEVTARFELPDGKVLTSTNRNGFTSFSRNWDDNALQTIFGDVVLVNAERYSYRSETLLSITSDEFHQYGQTPGVLSLDVDAAITSYRIAAEIPLVKNARYDSGSEHVVVANILQQPSGCTVMLRESRVNLMFAGSGNKAKRVGRRTLRSSDEVLYVLRNKSRGEAMLPKQDLGANIFGAQEGQRLVVRPYRLIYEPEQNRGASWVDIDEEWLKGADLVRVEVVHHGNCSSKVRVEDFELSSGRSRRSVGSVKNRHDDPDLDALAKIVLPEHPTRRDAEKYVSDIIKVSENQNRKSSKDPQVEMLAKVGPEYLDVLMEKSDDSFYFDLAIRQLAGPEHKDLILKALPRQHDLVSVVKDQGWENDARDMLIGELKKRPNYLPSDWIEAVAGFQDPATYEDLKQYLKRGNNRKNTYEAIVDLPGIDLRDAVAEAWKRSKYGSEYEQSSMLPVAIRYGHMDALSMAADRLSDTSDDYGFKRDLERYLRASTPFQGESKDFPAWFRAHRDQLYFDEDAHAFKLKSET